MGAAEAGTSVFNNNLLKIVGWTRVSCRRIYRLGDSTLFQKTRNVPVMIGNKLPNCIKENGKRNNQLDFFLPGKSHPVSCIFCKHVKAWVRSQFSFILQDGYLGRQLCIPEGSLRENNTAELHGGGLGGHVTLAGIRRSRWLKRIQASAQKRC